MSAAPSHPGHEPLGGGDLLGCGAPGRPIRHGPWRVGPSGHGGLVEALPPLGQCLAGHLHDDHREDVEHISQGSAVIDAGEEQSSPEVGSVCLIGGQAGEGTDLVVGRAAAASIRSIISSEICSGSMVTSSSSCMRCTQRRRDDPASNATRPGSSDSGM